ncbi:MAG: sugar phosphate isomerase/epimerase [Bacteroidota bacterium]|nr:sugar phosphate isomerase/epimerase [Bacteroidota bacterium]MDE2834586.1 sugar phosphate isomerase/epimerase [Bacteroidota bacterium]MDE2956281.1 sugar phosphate isomerase/epimerase [Bacteroidota bacterium]
MSSNISRRRFLQTAGLASAAMLTVRPIRSWSRPSVQVGAISYSFRQIPSSAEEILGYMQTLGLTTVELMGTPAEVYAGAPPMPPFRRGQADLSLEERREARAARRAAMEEVSKWRVGADLTKFVELGEMYRDGGVEVDILKLGNANWSDEELDYAYQAARAVGARGVSFEIANDAAERMGAFADKHDLLNGMHNHTQVADEGFTFEQPLSYSANNMLNLDIGHYVAGLGESPIPVIRKFHDRISHLHLKDRRTPENGQDNVIWGEGDTPIGEVLRLLRDEGYPIPAMIELEYPIPEDSSVMEEMARCAAFCRDALDS